MSRKTKTSSIFRDGEEKSGALERAKRKERKRR